MKIGDVIMLKSGGPHMTIVGFRGNDLVCQWFEKDKLKELIFPEESVQPYIEPPLEMSIEGDI